MDDEELDRLFEQWLIDNIDSMNIYLLLEMRPVEREHVGALLFKAFVGGAEAAERVTAIYLAKQMERAGTGSGEPC